MTVLKRRGFFAPLAAVVLVTGCGSDGGDPGTAQRSGWVVSDEATFVAGALDDPHGLAFDRVSQAVRLSDGRIVVADGTLSSRLSVLDVDGSPIATIGRNGEGPGEFTWLTSLQALPGDTLAVFDASQQRLTIFTFAGPSGRTAAFAAAGGLRLGLVTRLTDGSWIGKSLDEPIRGPTYQILRDTVSVGTLDPPLRDFRPFVALPSLMSTTTPIGNTVGWGMPAFSPLVLQAVWGNCVFLTTGEDAQIRVYSGSGKLLSTIEAPGEPRPVSSVHVEAWLDFRLASAPEGEAAALRRVLESAARPEVLPFHSQMVVDQWGYIWLQPYAPPMGTGRRWRMISQEGVEIDSLELPLELRMFSVSEEGVLGAAEGEFGENVLVDLPLLAHPEGSGIISDCRVGTPPDN